MRDFVFWGNANFVMEWKFFFYLTAMLSCWTFMDVVLMKNIRW